MADVIASNNNYAGGISFSSTALQLGAQNGAQVNGGFNFDLPLSTVAAFTNRALSFSANNSRQAQGFLSGVISNTQSNVSQSSQSALDFMTANVSALSSMNAMNQSQATYRTGLSVPWTQSGGGGGCFITTAICEARCLPDDCEELQILREFRDTYMMATCRGRNLVRQYYERAPQIAARLSYEQCEKLRREYLEPAITFIVVGDNQSAEVMYTLMVRKAAQMAGV